MKQHDDNIPRTFALYQNYPNPFNPSTIIKYQLPKSEHVKITIFNILGQQVRLLVDTKKDADIYSVDWDGCDDKGVSLASGVYLCRMEASDFVFLRKMLIIR
ncbi:MAG TPA: T9SS type A sorting domain-containing protein [bacterium]